MCAFRPCLLTLTISALAVLSACGGGSATTPPPVTYTIGGAVSGLSGAGLVLQNNATDNLPISGNGNFTFSTSITSGGTYKVTVSTQPSGQTCTVANGSGTANANVTNVQVTCAAIVTYTIGGTVSGLAGAGLILQDNGGDNLAIGGNGSFTFATPIDSGETYGVTVSTPPTAPLQACVIANGSGTANANVTNVAVACSTPTEQVLYTFGNAPDGNTPTGSFVFDGSGNLYGTTEKGGAFGQGTVFELSPGAGGQWTEKILYSFCPQSGCADGSAPNGGLIFDTAGNLYGTTTFGGASDLGVSFELTPKSGGTWTETVLHSFGSGTDGFNPSGGLVLDSAGNLYGTTTGGGTGGPNCPSSGSLSDCGTVFELSPGSGSQWTETVLYNFCSQPECADGNTPHGGLIVDSSGNLYGTTTFGGTSTEGIVFELSPSKDGQWVYSTIFDFPQSGGRPLAGLAQDKAGNLYGTAPYLVENGGVFSLTPGAGGTWTENVLLAFCSAGCQGSGGEPVAGVVFDKTGNLYGQSPDATSLFPNGTVFELMPGQNGTWTELILYGGGFGNGSLVLDGAGNLYGAGSLGNGIVYEVTP